MAVQSGAARSAHSVLVLVINLDRSPERLQRIGERLDTLGLAWERLPASDGKLLDMDDPALLDRAEFGRRHGKHPLPGELGCYLSHVRAMRRLIESSAEFGLILEDDVQLESTLPEVIAALLTWPMDWDLVKLSGIHRGNPMVLRPLTEHHDLDVMLTRSTTSGAYLINRHCASWLAERLLPMRIPFDHEFDRGWHWDIKVRYVQPFPVLHDQGVASTINEKPALPSGLQEGGGHRVSDHRFHWVRRLPAFGWRARNEVARAVYGLKAWWSAGRQRARP